MSEGGTQTAARGVAATIARVSVAGLLGYALATKLIDPRQLLDPLELGLGLERTAAGVGFVLTVIALFSCIALLLLRRGGSGLLLSGVFFIAGSVYAVLLSRQDYAGGCGCGVSIAQGAERELVIHAYQNAACAALCLFLGFRQSPSMTVLSTLFRLGPAQPVWNVFGSI